MKDPSWPYLPDNNLLAAIHIAGSNFLPQAREEICRVLNWSESKYYRRMLCQEPITGPELSAILEVLEKQIATLDSLISKYR